MCPERIKHILKNINNRLLGNRPTLITVTLIIILGLAIYANSMNGRLIYDDEILIKRNVYIKNWSYLPKIFTEDIGSGAGQNNIFWRPLQMFTYMIDYSLWGLDVKGYHLTNTLLHILAALVLYWLIYSIYQDKALSLFTGLFFMVHPIHTEAVAYISSRADSLSGIFMLLCLIFYIKQLHLKRISLYILMTLSYALALLSKEYSLILPALLLLYHYSFKKRLAVWEFLSLLSLAFIYILLRVTILKSMSTDIGSYPTTILQRVPGLFVAITNYMRLMVLPFNLHMEYGDKLFRFSDPKAMLGILISVSFLTYAFWIRNRNRLIFFSISWFFVTLLPVSNLYPVNAYMAEHWLYIPSIGFFLILADCLSRIYINEESGCFSRPLIPSEARGIFRDPSALRALRMPPSLIGKNSPRGHINKNLRIFATASIASSLAFYSYLTIKQNNYWREPMSFYERTLKYSPDCPKLYDALGLEYSALGNYKKAIALYKKAIALRPDYLNAYNNLGLEYSALGNYKRAIALYKRAIALRPDYLNAYNNLGVAYRAIGKNRQAIASYRKAIEINSDCASAYSNIGIVYATTGRKEDAIEMFKKAIEIRPDFASAYYNLGIAYREMGEVKLAEQLFRRAKEVDPTFEKKVSLSKNESF